MAWEWQAKAIRPEAARELEPALRPDWEDAVLPPDEASVGQPRLKTRGAVLKAVPKKRAGDFAMQGKCKDIWPEGNASAFLRRIMLDETKNKVSADWPSSRQAVCRRSIAGSQ